MKLQRKAQIVKRYKRVQNKIKSSMVESDVNTYVKQLIQATRLQNNLITEMNKI